MDLVVVCNIFVEKGVVQGDGCLSESVVVDLLLKSDDFDFGLFHLIFFLFFLFFCFGDELLFRDM